MVEIRALTVRQPYASAIIWGGKGVDNRSRNIAGSYRGPVAIHAGLKNDTAAWERLGDAMRWHRPDSRWNQLAAFFQCTLPLPDGWQSEEPLESWPSPQLYVDYGAIIGVVNLVDVHEPGKNWQDGETGRCSDWAEPDMCHLILENPRPLAEPIPWKGRQGLWKLDVDPYLNWHTTGLAALL